MRLHLNNLRGVDWVQGGEGGGGFWIRGCRSIAPLSICGRNIEKGIGGILGQRERDFLARYACSLGTNGSSLSLSRF